MIIYTCDQYSPEWWDARTGVPTASNASKIITPKKGGLSAQAIALRNELIANAMGYSDEAREPTEWELRGHELEPEARAAFTFETDIQTTQVGFVLNDDQTAGCSPDSLIQARNDWTFDGAPVVQIASSNFTAGLEIKCPKPSTMIGYLIDGTLPDYYKPQVHWSMATTGLRAWWFMAYHPEMRPLIVRVAWDDYTDAVAKAIADFAAMMSSGLAVLATTGE